MAKEYRLVLNEIDEEGNVKKHVADIRDTGYYVSHMMKSLAKRIYEPAPIVKLEGQQEIDL